MKRVLMLLIVCAPAASWASGVQEETPWWLRVLTVKKCLTNEGRESLRKYFKIEEPEELVELEETPGLSLYWGPVYVPSEEDRRALEETAILFFLTGRTLVVAGGYRTLKIQIGLACDEILLAKRQKREPLIPGKVALPGTSMHGRLDRIAVDVQLGDEHGMPMWTSEYHKQWKAPKRYIEELAALMYSVGWYRYVAEIWHFERQPRRNVRLGCYTYPDGPGCVCEKRQEPKPKATEAQVASAQL